MRVIRPFALQPGSQRLPVPDTAQILGVGLADSLDREDAVCVWILFNQDHVVLNGLRVMVVSEWDEIHDEARLAYIGMVETADGPRFVFEIKGH